MMLSNARVKAQPNVLWCYSKDLELSSAKKKRMKQIKKLESKGSLDKDEINAIELFMSSKDIRFCYYKDSHKILG
jgi:N-acetyltransferase 10